MANFVEPDLDFPSPLSRRAASFGVLFRSYRQSPNSARHLQAHNLGNRLAAFGADSKNRHRVHRIRNRVSIFLREGSQI